MRNVHLGTMVIALMCAFQNGCASARTIHWFEQPVESPLPNVNTVGERFGIMTSPIMARAVLWDVVTFPIQLAGGYYPYGDKLAPQ